MTFSRKSALPPTPVVWCREWPKESSASSGNSAPPSSVMKSAADHLVEAGEQRVWDLRDYDAHDALLLSYASDSDDVEFRVLLANLECSLKFGGIAPTL